MVAINIRDVGQSLRLGSVMIPKCAGAALRGPGAPPGGFPPVPPAVTPAQPLPPVTLSPYSALAAVAREAPTLESIADLRRALEEVANLEEGVLAVLAHDEKSATKVARELQVPVEVLMHAAVYECEKARAGREREAARVQREFETRQHEDKLAQEKERLKREMQQRLAERRLHWIGHVVTIVTAIGGWIVAITTILNEA